MTRGCQMWLLKRMLGGQTPRCVGQNLFAKLSRISSPVRKSSRYNKWHEWLFQNFSQGCVKILAIPVPKVGIYYVWNRTHPMYPGVGVWSAHFGDIILSGCPRSAKIFSGESWGLDLHVWSMHCESRCVDMMLHARCGDITRYSDACIISSHIMSARVIMCYVVSHHPILFCFTIHSLPANECMPWCQTCITFENIWGLFWICSVCQTQS